MNFQKHCLIIFKILLIGINGNSDPFDGPSSQNDTSRDAPGEPLSSVDFQNADNIPAREPPDNAPDAMEKADEFEGDIILNPKDFTYYDTEKNAVAESRSKWPNAVVPYTISARFSEQERAVIAKGILEFHRQTCVSFKPRSTETDYVMIAGGNGCSSSVGRVGGPQHVTLGDGCIYTGIVMHELMHSVGFWHEQSRWDRDDFITVNYQNIQPGSEDNFKKVSRREAHNFSAPYDTSSIMHYGPYAFSKSRQSHYKTIVPKVPNERMGQRLNFSETDLFKINKLYKCNMRPENNGSEAGTTRPTSQSPPSHKNETESQNTDSCADNNKHCKYWADNGECEKNPNWMLVNCKQSCNQCSSCVDDNKHCETWAANGECSKNPGYMNVHCAKACKQC